MYVRLVNWLRQCILLTMSTASLLLLVAPLGATEPLRLVTFNVQILVAPGAKGSRIERYRFDAARQRHLEQIASVVESLEPDILNIAEVTSAEAVEQLVSILHEKGLSDYRGYHVEGHDEYSGMDIALITRRTPDNIAGQQIRTIHSAEGDPTWRESFTFLNRDGREITLETSLDRNALYFFTIGNYRLGFLGLHLKSNPADEYSNARRTAEAKLVQRVIRDEIVARGYQPIVWGDLNDYDPDFPDRDDDRDTVTEVLRMLKDYDPRQEGQELVNVTRLIRRKQDRYSSLWDRNENSAEDPFDVKTLIDHALLPPVLVNSVQRVFFSRTFGLEVSDHWPLVIDLELSVD